MRTVFGNTWIVEEIYISVIITGNDLCCTKNIIYLYMFITVYMNIHMYEMVKGNNLFFKLKYFSSKQISMICNLYR